ncbi:AzlD family protein [Kiloniella sp.]|uniref:AzlD family protein n=1 Tax=Kiloniella sp. TaxID=1938587 RepID=UPI003B013F29
MHDIIALILACAAATYLTRIGGHVILSRFGSTHYRIEAALVAVPTAVLTALVAPSLLTNGPAEALAILLAGAVALRASLMMSVAAGLISLMALRFILV